MQNPRPPGGKGSRVASRGHALAGGFHPHQSHAGVADEFVESANGVAAPAHAGDHRIGQPAGVGYQLRPRFPPDDGLEIPHQHRIGMGPHRAADQVMGRLHIGDPVADGFVDGVFQSARAGVDGDDLGAQQPHPVHIEGLAHRVLGAHIDDALQAQHRAHGSRGHAVLPGAGFGNNAPLAHPLRQQALPQGIVDFVGAGMGQILPLQVDARPAAAPGQVFGIIQGGRTARVAPQQVVQAFRKSRVVLGGAVRPFQFGEGCHHRFGDELAPEIAEAAAGVGQPGMSSGPGCRLSGKRHSQVNPLASATIRRWPIWRWR